MIDQILDILNTRKEVVSPGIFKPLLKETNLLVT